MAQLANTFAMNDMVGIREDLQDIIYDVSPEETPFYSACAKLKATQTLHEWQTDALRSSADNAHIEGDETVAAARTATTRLGNRTQIFKDAVIISGTEKGTDKAGRASEMAYQTMKIAKEQKLDIERALFANQAAVAGSDILPRRLAGIGAWITTNTNNVGGGGADPTGDGSNARTDGSLTAFSQPDFDLTMQEIWAAGGRPNKVYLSAFQMNVALGFTGNNNQRSNVDATSDKVVKTMDLYITPWGKVEFIPTRENRSRDVWILQSDMWAVGVRRPTFNEELAKNGDNERRQVITELTLISKNQRASGGVVDCTIT
jgi:hypothetical protein